MKQLFEVLLRPEVPAKIWQVSWLLYRVSISLAMIGIHGSKKLLDFSGTVATIPDPFALGGTMSTVIALLANVLFAGNVMLGFLTRLSALFIVGVTLVGLLVVHMHDPWSVKDIPLMYSLAFGLMAIGGGGRYSVDHWLHQKLSLNQREGHSSLEIYGG